MNKNILAVGAHPDDIEFLCAGTLSLLQERGFEISLATISRGDCGSSEKCPQEISRIRKGEAEESAEILNATYACVGENDFAFDYETSTRRKVVDLIRKNDPKIVFTMCPEGYIADHIVTSKLVRDACYVAAVPNYEGSSVNTSIDSVPYLYYANPMENKTAIGSEWEEELVVDISSSFGTKKKMLACHKSQRNWLRDQSGVDKYMELLNDQAREVGEKINVEYGEGFTQHTGHGYPQENILKDILEDNVCVLD